MLSKPYSVLIVDDEAEMCEVIEVMLAQHFRVDLDLSSTASSEEAIQRIEKDKFDIVLTDLTMPDYSGYDIAQKIWEKDRSTELIFFTGHVEESVCSTCFRNGSSAIIFKPISPGDLIKVVSMSINKLDYWSYTYDHKLRS